MHLRRRLVAAVVLGGLLVAVLPVPTVAAATVAATILISIVVADVVVAPRPGNLSIARDVPRILRLGRPATVTLRMHNPTSRALRVDTHDATPPSMDRSPRRHHVTIEPGAWVELSATLHPARRGRARLGPITVRTTGPFGLAGRQNELPIVDEVKVYPALRARAEIELQLRRARLLQTGQRSSAIRGGGSEFDSLRDYRPDDEFRRINWRATARSQRAIANEYREEHNQQVLILLDASRATAGQVQGVSRLEHALDAAIAVGELTVRVGDHVGAAAFAREVLASVDARGGRVQTRRILDLLFDVEPRLDAADYPGAFGSILRRNRRRSWLVLFTDLSEASVLEPLLRAIPILLARHLVVVAAVRDPALGSLATMSPSNSEEVYAAAAAAGFLTWRDRAAATVRRLGGVCIDRPPGELAAAVADEYLRVKSLGLL